MAAEIESVEIPTATEKKETDIEEIKKEIVVAECPWVRGRSYAVKSFKKLLPPIYQKALPASGKLRITKITPTSHYYGGYNIEACWSEDKEVEYRWIQFWWTTQDKFYYANFSEVSPSTP